MIFSAYSGHERAVVDGLKVLGLEGEAALDSRVEFRSRLRERLVAAAATGEHLDTDLCQAC